MLFFGFTTFEAGVDNLRSRVLYRHGSPASKSGADRDLQGQGKLLDIRLYCRCSVTFLASSLGLVVLPAAPFPLPSPHNEALEQAT